MSLERELETYEQRRAEWLAAGQEGRWVVIHGPDVLDLFDSLDAAAEAGYRHFGLSELFMVRQVSQPHAPLRVSRRAVDAHRQPSD